MWKVCLLALTLTLAQQTFMAAVHLLHQICWVILMKFFGEVLSRA